MVAIIPVPPKYRATSSTVNSLISSNGHEGMDDGRRWTMVWARDCWRMRGGERARHQGQTEKSTTESGFIPARDGRGNV